MRKIICAFYNPAVKNFDGYNSLMSVIVENRKKIRPIYFEEVDGQFLIVFYEDRLKKIEKYLSGEALKQYEEIGEKYRQCAVCQCKYLSYIPYTYRKICGMVGRSYECEVCQSLSNRDVIYVKEYAKKHGTKKTLRKIGL